MHEGGNEGIFDEDDYCVNCMFFVLIGNEIGECRRYAPRPQNTSPIGVSRSHWPIVEEDDFCGEFKTAALPEPGEN